MATYSGTGTCVSVSAAAPATFDEAGFAALTYDQVGELETFPEFKITHAAVTFTNLCTGVTDTSKGAAEAINIDIGLAMDRSDAGQAIMSTARASLTAQVSIRVTESDGATLYFRALVMSEVLAGGAGSNDVRKGMYGLGVKTQPSGLQHILVTV